MFSEKDNTMFEASRGYRIEKTTYGDCQQSVLRRAAALENRLEGVPAGSVIGLYLPNCREWIELFWAILACGYNPLLMNMRLDRASLYDALHSVDAKAVIIGDGTECDFSLPFVRVCDTDGTVEADADRPFGSEVLVMSSGTSDHVKVCAYSAEEFFHIISDSVDIIKSCPAIKKHYKGQLKLLAFLPFCHIFGLVAVYIWFAFFSRTFVLLNDMTPKTIVDTIRRHEVTHIFAVPMFWNKVREEALKTIRTRGEKTEAKFENGLRIAKRLGSLPLICSVFRRFAFREVRSNLFGNSICFMISGGSEIEPAVLEFFNLIGYRLANGYGMTEIGITSVELSSDLRLLTSGSVGLPFGSVEYSVSDSGELLVRGGSTARRIIEGGSISQKSGDWFRTGDLAEFRNGRYYILGRKDDIIISPTGENLNPLLIEEKLMVPGVRECCLVGERSGNEIKPVLLFSMKPLLDPERIRAAYDEIKARLNANGLDRQISRVLLVREPLISADEFKLNRTRIAKRLKGGEFTFIDPNAANGTTGDGIDPELLTSIRSRFASALGKELSEIPVNADFFLDLGGTSLDYFGIVSELQNEFGIAFPVDSGRSLSRADEIARFIEGAVNEKLS